MEKVTSRVQEVLGQISWRHEVKVAPLSGGLTNHVFLLRKGDKLYTLRIFGEASSHFVDRQAELFCHSAFGSLGLAPAVVKTCQKSSFLITKFVEGKIISHKEYCETPVFTLLASSMRKLHQSGQEIPRVFEPIAEAKKLLSLVMGKKELCFERQRMVNLFNQMRCLLARLATELSTYVPCHLDLVPGNVILKPCPRAKFSAILIDWEYAAMAPLELEFANIFTELATTQEKEQELLRIYFGKEDVGSFHQRVKSLRCFTLFYWTLWCLIQAELSTLKRDYKDYGLRYLEQAEELARELC